MKLVNFRTSGAYVLYQGRFVFQVGPNKAGNVLGIVRLGGHREKSETAIETAKREVLEEAGVHINILDALKTYHILEWDDEPIDVLMKDPIRPILIKGREGTAETVMYLSYTDTAPRPAAETKGLLLLSPQDIHKLCCNKLTLNDFERNNGLSIIKSEMNKNLVLQPFPQLLFLSRLLREDIFRHNVKEFLPL
ncbi:NUDIX hydrolase [Paucisalibacillus globulus]|uniref:NUDIX hydrolase n=1 Tax=Paucisalibacillus globulus TaxID=351095 RepID=UPI0004126079|nr:NUDIX domain-containing protein [Paucisalibacillus globulus]